MFREEILNLIKTKLQTIYTEFSNMMEDQKRLNELYDLAPRIIKIGDIQLDIIEEEFIQGLKSEHRGFFHTSHATDKRFFIAGKNIHLIDTKSYFVQDKINYDDLVHLLKQSIEHGKPYFKVRFAYNDFLSLPASEQTILKTRFLKERMLDNVSNILLQSDKKNTISLDAINHLNKICLGSHNIQKGIEKRFVNMLFSTLGGQPFPQNFNEISTEIGFFHNSISDNHELLFSIYQEYSSQLNSNDKIPFLQDFYSHFRNPSPLSFEIFQEEILKVIDELFYPDTLSQFNLLFDKKLLKSLLVSEKIEHVYNLINERFSANDIQNVFSNQSIYSNLKKIFKRYESNTGEINSHVMHLFTITSENAYDWGIGDMALSSANLFEHILTSLQIQYIVNHKEDSTYSINIFLEKQDDVVPLNTFLKNILRNIDDGFIDFYPKEEFILSEWKEFRLHQKLNPDNKITRKAKHKI